MAEVSTSLSAYKIMRPHFTTEAEEIWVLALDSKLNLLGKKMVFRGTVNSCPIHPRDIFRYLILQNACAFILAHNHPSQDPLPSEEDLKVTHKLQSLSELLEIPLVDHIVVTQDKYYSFADFNLIVRKKTTERRRRRI